MSKARAKRKPRRRTKPAPDSPKRASWRVFVYLAGDNNLSEEMMWSLLEMQEAAADSSFRERVCLDAVYDPIGWAPLVYRFHGDSKSNLEDLREERSTLQGIPRLTSMEQLRYFIDQQLGDPNAYPPGQPQKTLLILSGHADGLGGILSEKDATGSLTIRQLGKLLEYAVTRSRNTLLANQLTTEEAGAARFEILGMESCAMSMLELCYEVRDSVDYLIGTESFVANNGWPYRRILKPLLDRDSTVEGIARRIADTYADYYTEYDIAGVSSDVAVVRLAKLRWSDQKKVELPPLLKTVRTLAIEMTELLAQAGDHPLETDGAPGQVVTQGPGKVLRDSLLVARWNAQSYRRDDYVDLWDFCYQLIRALATAGDPKELTQVRTCCEEIMRLLPSVVPVSRYQGPDYQHSHGLAIYFPTSRARYAPSYRDLAFAEDARWASFLELFLQRTQRGVRLKAESPVGLRRYSYEANATTGTILVPGASVRANPDEGTRANPDEGTRANPDEGTRGTVPHGCRKNGPTEWYRDPPTTTTPEKPSKS